MSYRLEELARQTEIRLSLLRNGYSPVPNYDKRCFLYARNDLHIDEALIDKWSRETKNLSTGVRVEGRLIAIDIDVADAEAIAEIVEALPEAVWEKVQHAPVRRSTDRTKEAWFVTLAPGEKPISRLTSAAFHHPHDPKGQDGATHRVEIFGGESGQQMGVFGAHTRDDSDVTVVRKEYVWDGPSIVDVPLDALPVLTRADLVAICDAASDTLTALGWTPKEYLPGGFSKPQVLFDLTDDMIFETQEHGDLTLGELYDEARNADRGLRLAASFHSKGSHNVTRCIASVGDDGALRIKDFETAHTHRVAAEAPRTVTEDAMERLRSAVAVEGSIFSRPAPAPRAEAAAAEEAAEAAEAVGEAGDALEQAVEILLATHAYCASENRCVLPLEGGAERAMSMTNFRGLMKPHAVTVRGPRGAAQTLNPADLWLASDRRIDVNGHRFRPDVSDVIIDEADGRYLNLFRPLPWPGLTAQGVASAGAAFEALLEHLVPDVGERDWFRMWLASKIQRPQAANCGVLLIADQQGTGRGTLFDMMRAAVGRPYYRSISSVELLGLGGQGAYTDWAAQALLVTVEEVMAGADSGNSMGWKRREAYERIKQLVDPRQRVMEIRRKGMQNYAADVFFSLLMATNHLDALPLDRNDRRIAVIIQPDVRFEDVEELKAAVDPWRAGGSFGDDFGAALRQHLLSVAVDFGALRIAPELSGGRDVMRDANEGDLEDILRSVLGNVPGEYIANGDLRRRAQLAVTAYGEGEHLRNWWVKVQDALKRPNAFGWRAMPVRQTYVGPDGKQKLSVVYYREAGGGLSHWQATPLKDRYDALLAPSADVNRMLSALDAAAREGRLKLV
jgi:hypothetical protein